MSDDRQDREDKIFVEELKKQEDLQEQREFLKDRSIGGANAPRPTDDFIDRSLGKDQNRMEMTATAAEKTGERMKAEDAKDRHQEKHDRADRKRTQSQTKAEQPKQDKSDEKKQSFMDRLKQKRDNGHDRKRGR